MDKIPDDDYGQRRFRSAFVFEETGRLLNHISSQIEESGGEIVGLQVPGSVNLAFALEIYFKAIRATEGHLDEGHSLIKLFQVLSPEWKARITEEYNNLSETAYGPEYEGIETAIQQSAKIFLHWRYLYERYEDQVISPADYVPSNWRAGLVVPAARLAILKVYPDWRPWSVELARLKWLAMDEMVKGHGSANP